MDFQIRQLVADDAEAFSKLRRELTADNPIPMGLTMEEELSRPIQGFRDQLSYPEPNAAFGAFVNIGIKENGLIHKSQLAETYVEDPAQFISLHEHVEVQVLEVDASRKRVGLKRIIN